MKCPHDVYIPSDMPGNKSPYCSGCQVPDPLPPGAKLSQVVGSPFPYGEKACPVCGSKKFRYKNEWDYHCNECGTDALDV